MQLEVGKKYITKDPDICDYVEVIDFSLYFPYPFRVKCCGGLYNELVVWYTLDGRVYSHQVDEEFYSWGRDGLDLIAEYQKDVKFNLEETHKQLEDLCNWK